MTNRPVMPAFVFDRRRSAELEAGFVLAGQLIVDLPKRRSLKPRHARQVGAIVQMLVAEARSRGLPEDGMVIGWAGGVKPEGAVDVHDDAIMGAWRRDRWWSRCASTRAMTAFCASTATR
jgi:hypothetical protein